MARRIELLSYCPDGPTRSNARYSIIEGMYVCVMVGLVTPFTTMYAMRWGASDYMISLLTSLPALVGLLAQLPAAHFAGRAPSLLRLLIRSAAASRLSYLFFALLPFVPVPPLTRAWLFIAVFSLANFPGTVSNVTWQAMMGEMFPGELRGRVFGERSMITGLVTLVFTWLAGRFFDRTTASFPWNYSLVFAVSFAALMISLHYLTRLREERPASVRERQAGSVRGFAWRSFTDVLRNRGFLIFALAVLLFHVGFHLPSSVVLVLWIRILGLPEGWIGTFSVVNGLASVLIYRWWGRVVDRRGSGFVLICAFCGFAFLPIVYTYVFNPYGIAFFQLLAGLAAAALNLGLFSSLLERAPEAARADYIAVFNLLVGLSAATVPVIGVAMLKTVGLPAVTYTATAFRLVAIGWLVATGVGGVTRRPALSGKA